MTNPTSIFAISWVDSTIDHADDIPCFLVIELTRENLERICERHVSRIRAEATPIGRNLFEHSYWASENWYLDMDYAEAELIDKNLADQIEELRGDSWKWLIVSQDPRPLFGDNAASVEGELEHYTDDTIQWSCDRKNTTINNRSSLMQIPMLMRIADQLGYQLPNEIRELTEVAA